VAAEIRSVLARVNGEPVYVDEFKRELRRIQIKTTDGLPSDDTLRIQARALLQDWVNRRLILQEAKARHLVVGIDEVEAAFQRVKNGWESPKEFEDSLKSSDLTFSEMKSELRDLLMIRLYFRDVVFSRIAVKDSEIEDYIRLNPGVLVSPERVKASQIVVKSEEDAKKVARELRKGMTFADAAMKYSLGPEGKSGGDLGVFARGEMPAVFDEVCFKLRPGSVSAVVGTDYGFHLFMVTEKFPETQRSLGEVRGEVERELRFEVEKSAQETALDALRERADLKLPTENDLDVLL
jgi:parvulin-like peptidyl-prolyl isomerase